MAIHAVRSSLGGNLPPVKSGTLNGTSAYIVNELVYRETSGGTLASNATGAVKVAGILTHAGTGPAEVAYIPAVPGVEVLIDASGAVGNANLGKNYGVTITSGVAVLNLSETTNTLLKVQQVERSDATAGIYRVWASFVATKMQEYDLLVS